jgi:hypothetical protein
VNHVHCLLYNMYCLLLCRTQIIECREYLKQFWDDGDMGDFIEDTIDKVNSRLFGATTGVPSAGADAMDYLDRGSYSDDDWLVESDAEEPEEAAVKKEEAAVVKVEGELLAVLLLPCTVFGVRKATY